MRSPKRDISVKLFG